MNKVKELQDKIFELQEELKKAKLKAKKVRSLGAYNSLEKSARFDSLYRLALGHLNRVEEGRAKDDDEHFMFEAIMNLLSPEDGSIWDYYNSLSD